VDLPNPLRELTELLKAAVKLEVGTPAGKVNCWGLLLVLVLVSLGTVTGWIEDVIRIYRPHAVSSPTDFTQLFVIFVLLVFACVIIVAIDSRNRSGKGRPDADKDEGPSS
jgi:hypothetical protein